MSEFEVYTPILGATITLDLVKANMLIAFLAFVLSSVVSSSVWSIAAFFLHRASASRIPSSDPIAMQRRVVLRNAATAATGSWALLKVWHAWTAAKDPRVLSRTLKFWAPTLLIAVFFPVASIMIPSWIATEPSEQVTVLMKPGRCGFTRSASLADMGTIEWASNNLAMLTEVMQARRYAADWYSGTPDIFAGSSVFPQSTIAFDVDTNASFPFAPELSPIGQNAAVSFDTGLLDSHAVYGINAPPRHRIEHRRRVTCAPVSHGDFSEIDYSSLESKDLWWNVYFADINTSTEGKNYTFSWRNISGLYR